MNWEIDNLQKSRVHIGGCGRIGSGIALSLAAAGVGYVSCNDPQECEEEQLSTWVFARRSDLGRAKVHVLERFLDGYPGFTFEPIVAPNQARKLEPYLAQADVIISCANSLEARLYLEQAAVRLKKPCIQGCAQDSRKMLGGLISIWRPEANHSCFACLFSKVESAQRGEWLQPTVTSTIASLTAHLAVEMLAGRSTGTSCPPNIFAVDLTRLAVEALSVEARPGCQICGQQEAS